MNVPASDSTTAAPGLVELALPLDHRHASTVRVVAAALGADAGFNLDEIDDLRLAVDEAVAAIVAAQRGGPDNGDAPGGRDAAARARVILQFETEPGAVSVRVSRSPAAPLTADDIDALALRIMRAVADEFQVDGAVHLTKRAVPHDGGG